MLKLCKGLIFRCNINSFLSSHNSIETRKSLRLLKRKSCTGCQYCEWIWEALQEDIYELINDDYLEFLEHNKMYKLVPQWHPGSYKYQEAGDLELDFEEIKEN